MNSDQTVSVKMLKKCLLPKYEIEMLQMVAILISINYGELKKKKNIWVRKMLMIFRFFFFFLH